MSGLLHSLAQHLFLPRLQKAVLVAIADEASSEGIADPSLVTLAKRTDYSRRAVIEALAQLEAAGWVRRMRQPGAVNRYEVNAERLIAEAQPTLDVKHRAAVRATGAVAALPPVQKLHPPPCSDCTTTRAEIAPVPAGLEPVRVADSFLLSSNNNINSKSNIKSGSARARAHDANAEANRDVPRKVTGELVDTARGSRLPSGWEPDAKDAAFAELQLGSDWRDHLDAFRDYWTDQPGAKGRRISWSGTWRNWVRRDHDQRRGRSPGLPYRKSAGRAAIEEVLAGVKP